MSWKTAIARNLQSLKVLACPVSASSAGARSFWESHHLDVAALSPRFPFMLRPHPDAEPVIFVEYDFGRKVKLNVANLSASEIEAQVAVAVETGERMPRAYHQSVAPLVLPAVTE